MPINPITVTRLKSVLLMGHSNCDGWGATDKFFADTGDYASRAGGYPNDPTAAKDDPENAWWKNIYVFTSPQPFPGASHTPVTSNVGDGEWLEMTIANVKSSGDPHPHAHPFNYPNNRGACYPRYYYSAWVLETFDGFHHTPGSSQTMGTLMGVELPLMQIWRNYHQTQVGLIKVAFSSTLFLPAEIGSAPEPWLDIELSGYRASQQVGPLEVPSAVDPALGEQYAYWNPREQFDWAPSTDRLFKITTDKMLGAAEELPTVVGEDGNPVQCKLDIQMIVPWLGDNDSLTRDPATLRGSFKDAALALIERLRQFIDDNDMSSVPASEIPILWPGVHFTYTNPDPTFDGPGFCNGVLQEIADDDPRVTWVPSDAWTLLSAEGYETLGIFAPTHFSHTGYIQAAHDFMAAWIQNQVVSYDAISAKDRMTLAEVRTDVKLRYDRGLSESDLAPGTIDTFVNQAIRSIYNHAGPNAWWALRRLDLDIATSSTGIAVMPRHVAYVAWIENPCDPKRQYDFTQIGFGNGGKAMLQFDCAVNDTLKCHVISWPARVSKDDQLVPVPRQLSEWLVLETCRRMAAGGSDIAKRALFAGEEAQERLRAMNTIANVLVGQKDRLRSAEPPIRFGY